MRGVKDYEKMCRNFSVLITLMVALYMIVMPVWASPSNNYKLSGDEADDVVAVAIAQKGRIRGDFKFSGVPSGAWCGKFLSWCAEQAESSHVSKNITGAFTAIEYEVNSGRGEFYCFSDSKTHETNRYWSRSFYEYLKIYNEKGHNISKTGLSHVHEVRRGDFIPRKGDIIIILWSSDYTDSQCSHVGFVRSDYDGKGTVYTVEGNTTDGNTTGGVVALKSHSYNDTQIVGFVRPNYSSSSSKPNNVVGNKSVTLSASSTNVSLSLGSKESQTIMLTLGGDVPERCSLYCSTSDSNVASSAWGSYTKGYTVPVIVTAQGLGRSTITYSAKDINTGEILATASVNITVVAPSFSVQYDANGGANAPTTQTKEYQKPLSLSSDQPTRAGYVFSGWSSSSGGPVEYHSGDLYAKDQDLKLYAIWEPVKAEIIPSNAIEYNDHYYCYYDDSLTWLEAKEACEGKGGYLATITASDENTFISNMIQSGNKYFYWIGGSDELQEGQWEWITEENWGFENWFPRQPDNHSDINGMTENYLAMERIVKKWNDLQNSGDLAGDCALKNAGYICEWSGGGKQQATITDKDEMVYFDELSPSKQDRYTGNMGDSFIDIIGRRNGNVDVNDNSYEHGLTA